MTEQDFQQVDRGFEPVNSGIDRRLDGARVPVLHCKTVGATCET